MQVCRFAGGRVDWDGALCKLIFWGFKLRQSMSQGVLLADWAR